MFIRCNISYTSYADHLHKLGIKSLEYRRLEFDIILMFKIYHNLSDLQFDDYFIHSKRRYNLRSHELSFNPNFMPVMINFVISFLIVLLEFGIAFLDLVSAASL